MKLEFQSKKYSDLFFKLVQKKDFVRFLIQFLRMEEGKDDIYLKLKEMVLY
jgi:hypothetical protein